MKKDTLVLLSNELRKKVEAKVKSTLEIAEKEYNQKFEMPEIRYDIKNTHGGMAYYNAWLIRLNLILLVENEEEFINQTVPHEVAHLINLKVNKPAAGKKRLMPHGKEWQAVMKVLGVPAKRCHTYDCTSIDRSGKRRKIARAKVDRVSRTMKTVLNFTEEEMIEFKHFLKNI